MAEPHLIKVDEHLPPPATNDIKRRIRALKNLQLKYTESSAAFYKELHALDIKYAALYEPLYEKRKLIISSDIEISDEDCEYPTEEKDLAENEIAQQSAVEGIPEFWLTIFKNIEFYCICVKDWDEPILKHLNDVKVRYTNDPIKYILEFHFSPNEFFANSILTKEYYFKCAVDEKRPFVFNGIEFTGSRGCVINWKEGKDVTIERIQIKAETLEGITYRMQTITRSSFFNLFFPTNEIYLENERHEINIAQFENEFKDGVIAAGLVEKAVLYYTEEIQCAENDNVETEDEDEEEESESEDGYSLD